MPEPTEEEVISVLRIKKNHISPGSDTVTDELLKGDGLQTDNHGMDKSKVT